MSDSGESPLLWIVYGAGILAALVLFVSGILAAIAALTSQGAVHVSYGGLVLCLVLVGAAVALRVSRSRGRRR